MTETDDKTVNKTYFTTLEARVIACLMEKHLTTPNNYPLTLNSLQLACNQKSNRDPVMSLTEGQIGYTVNQLESRNLVRIEYGGRANHISHHLMNVLGLNKKKQSILTVLMLRAPLTLNDIKARTARMVEFEDVNEIHQVLTQIIDTNDPQLVVKIAKSPGSREDRYTHLLCGDVEKERECKTTDLKPRTVIKSNNDLIQRVEKLERQVKQLMQMME